MCFGLIFITCLESWRDLHKLFNFIYSTGMPLKSEYELSNPPNDGITRVSFAPINQSPLLLVSSWDTGVRLYDVSTPEGNMRSMYSHQYPVFDCCLIDNTRSFSAGLDRCLKTYDFQVSREDVLGKEHVYTVHTLYMYMYIVHAYTSGPVLLPT